jgi:hypothetical protein
VDGSGRWIRLLPSGEDESLPVTPATAARFVALAIRARIAELLPAARLLAHGLAAVVPAPLACLLSPAELSTRACGTPGIDVDVLAAHTRYEGFRPDSPVVARFWRVLRAMSPREQESLMRFIFARRRLPAPGPAGRWPHLFVLARMARDDPDASLPQGHTCSFQLDLPEYTTDAAMARQLRVACENSVEYDLDGGAVGV